MIFKNLYFKKVLVFISTVLVSITIAGLFGILHDQVTYSISNEYYTKFKFYQFGLINDNNNNNLSYPRLQVSAVGFLATWWVGKWIGLFLGSIVFMARESINMRKATLKALLIIFVTTIIFSIVGFIYGKIHLLNTGVKWSLPENLIDKDSFIIVGSIHNFSYLGGAIGLLISALFLIWQARIQTYTSTVTSKNLSGRIQ